MTLPEILIVLSSITAQDSLPKNASIPVVKVEHKVDSATKKITQPAKPVDKVKGKAKEVLGIRRGGWDRN